ncbi:copper amine oxidase [Clostridium sp. Bc-iso-3]|nr:copper amine oxidase [Clostridium sp. Bc-iso-3]
MGRITRKISLLLVVALLAVSVVACASDEISLIEAMSKSAKITSYEGNSKVQLSFNGKGFSEDTKKTLDLLAAYIDGFNLESNIKYSANEEQTKAKIAMDGNMDMKGLGVEYGYWMDMDLTGEKPQMIQIIELPPAITQPIFTLFSLGSKKYITIDYGAALGEQDADMPFDLKDITKDSAELRDMILDFIKTTAKDFDPGMVAVTKKGSAVTEKGENVTEYELKLDDASAKKLLYAFINDVILQEETMEFGKKYMEATLNIIDLPEDEKQEALAEIEKGLDDFAAELPTYREKVTQVYESIKNVKFFGDNGLVVKYYINNDGYVVGTKSSIDVEIKVADLAEVIGEFYDEEDKNGVISFTIDAESSIYNVNKEVSIELPKLTEENSFDIFNQILDGSSSIGFIPGIAKEEYPAYEAPILSDGINVIMNGNVVAFPDVKPENINGRVLVPIRTISDEMGAEISYNNETKQVLVVKEDKEIQLTLGSQEAYVNGELVMLDTPAMVIEGRTMVPLRFVSENMDAVVEWDGEAQIVYIFY